MGLPSFPPPWHTGNAPPVEEDERFSVVCSSLGTLLASQGSVYEREEHTMRVLMKEEVMEKMERSKKQAGEGLGRRGLVVC